MQSFEEFEFEEEFRDLCRKLNGRLGEGSIGEMVCVLDGAVIHGYPDFDSISVTKRGLDTLVVEGFKRTAMTRRFLKTGFLSTKRGLIAPIEKFGKHIGCFIAEVDGAEADICLNEKGEIVYTRVIKE